jgi:SAM-dependent methyltransferase
VDDRSDTSFARSARFYDAVYRARGKDYSREVDQLRRLLPRGGRTLRILDVGCGTGEHLRHLGSGAFVAGLDLDPAMLAEARRKLPAAPLFRADMRRFALRRRFDAVTCLFAAVGYLRDRAEVEQALACMAAPLREGGVLLVELPLGPEQLEGPRRSTLHARRGDIEIERWVEADREPEALRIRFGYSLREGSRVERFVEEHRILSLPIGFYQERASQLGLRARIEPSWPSGGGLLIGIRSDQGTRDGSPTSLVDEPALERGREETEG